MDDKEYMELAFELKNGWNRERKAATAITDLLARVEAEEARANDMERALCGMVANYFRVNEVAKKVLDYARDDDTPAEMKDDLHEAAIMLFGMDEAHRRAEQSAERAEKAEARAEKAERERDIAVDLCGKLIALCSPPKEWKPKLFRRHINRPGDYMGCGYDFLDSFNRILTTLLKQQIMKFILLSGKRQKRKS